MPTPTPPTVAPWGRWPSALDAATVAAGRRSRSSLLSDGTTLYWVERRPEEGGRQVVVAAPAVGAPDDVAAPAVGTDLPHDVTPPGASVRSRVHEYGGGAACLVPHRPGAVAWVEDAGQAVRLLMQGQAVDLSPAPPGGERWAHGDLRATPDGQWLLCVRERHLDPPAGPGSGPLPPIRELVAYPVPAGTGDAAEGPGPGVVLCAGRDFVAAPRPDATGRRLAWTCWDHPAMPWDAAEVWVGDLQREGGLAVSDARRVDGGDGVACGQPQWDGEGLVYASDRGGWWRPWRWTADAGAHRLTGDEAEYHGPDWALGQSTMARVAGGLVCRRRRDGRDALVVLDPATGAVRVLDQPCVTVSDVVAHGAGVAWLGATPYLEGLPWWSPVLASDGGPVPGRIVPSPVVPAAPVLAPPDVSAAEPFTCAGREGRDVHGLWYAPQLGGTSGPAGTAPPLLVFCHGGPTGAADPGFDPVVQFFTTRGFAVAAVDYAGSTGYGRAHREALYGRWGMADVDDCVDAALGLAAAGRVDGSRMAVRGSSAGGFTALSALVRSRAFAAAVAWYGVTDLEALAAVTHDFEAHYTERLVGPFPEAQDEYRRRSPARRTADLEGAVLLFQGLDDPVVPPAQASAMADALRAAGRRCELHTFPGESHGFRRADTVAACLSRELDFYLRELCGS